MAAEQGDASAQYNLGVMHGEGQGVPQDDAEAVKWLRLAAEQGDCDAQSNLGVMYSEGQGVPQNDAKALAWLEKAAEQDNVFAFLQLADFHREGRGTPRDKGKALAYLEKAMKKGDIRGQAEYAKLLLMGYQGARGILKGAYILGKTVGDVFKITSADTEDERLKNV